MVDMDDFFYTLHREVKGAPGGISGVATKLGIRPLTLIGQLSPNDETHYPNLAVFLRILQMVGATGSLDVLCQMAGGSFRSRTAEADASLISAILTANSEHADIGRMVMELSADGELDAGDKSQIRREIAESRRRLDVLENTLNRHEGGL